MRSFENNCDSQHENQIERKNLYEDFYIVHSEISICNIFGIRHDVFRGTN